MHRLNTPTVSFQEHQRHYDSLKKYFIEATKIAQGVHKYCRPCRCFVHDEIVVVLRHLMLMFAKLLQVRVAHLEDWEMYYVCKHRGTES